MQTISSRNYDVFDRTNTQNTPAEISALQGNRLTQKYFPRVSNEEVGAKVIEFFESQKKIPVLFFVDPWGYKAYPCNWSIPCSKIGVATACSSSITTASTWVSQSAGQEHMDALFGAERAMNYARPARRPAPRGTGNCIVEASCEALGESRRGRQERYVLPFTFKTRRESERVITESSRAKHPRGLSK